MDSPYSGKFTELILLFPAPPTIIFTFLFGQIFWVLYAVGLLLLPRQYEQEAAARKTVSEK